MSLGLSLAFAANPFRLLVSCLGSRETNSFNHDNNFEVGTTVLCILEMRTLKNNKVINSVLQGHTGSKRGTKF